MTHLAMYFEPDRLDPVAPASAGTDNSPSPGFSPHKMETHPHEVLEPGRGVVTQDRVALVFAERAEGAFRYCHSAGAWFRWTGQYWAKDECAAAFQYARNLARSFTSSLTDGELKEIGKVSFAAGVERFAQSDPRLAVSAEWWDNDPFLLGTPGGTVDLRTGELRPSQPSEGVSRVTAVAPDPEADCPRWLAFLDEVTGGDREVARFLQQWGGYCLTGATREHALVFVYGPGGNGKSVWLNTLTAILNGYATTAAMDTFTASAGDKHPTDLAMLRGARLVTASETEEGRAWAEARIKSLTGGDPITARFMRQDFFTFRPQFKLTVVGNHKPVLRNVDEAARRRFRIVPFTHKPANPDRELEAKLKAEWPAILRWMIDGCLDWQANGLIRPESVQSETDMYFEEQDVFGQWLSEECDAEPGNSYKSALSGDLFVSWREYAMRAGEPAGSQKGFAENLKRRGFEPRKATGGLRTFTGIRLRPKTASGGCGA